MPKTVIFDRIDCQIWSKTTEHSKRHCFKPSILANQAELDLVNASTTPGARVKEDGGFGFGEEMPEPVETRVEDNAKEETDDDEVEEDDPATTKLQQVLQDFEDEFGNIQEAQPRVGAFIQVSKGATEAWVGGSNIRPIKRPVDLMCRRPTDFRSAHAAKIACKRGLQGNKKLPQCSDEGKAITLND